MIDDFTAGPTDDRHELYDRFMAMVSDEPAGIAVDGKLAMVVMSKTAYDEMFDSKGNTDSFSEHLVKMHLAFMDIHNGRTISLEELSAVFCDGSEDADSDIASETIEKSASLAEAKAELLAHLAQSRDDFRNGRLYTSEEARAMIQAGLDAIRSVNGPTAEDLESSLDEADDAASSADERLSQDESIRSSQKSRPQG
ncbi:MAG: hypothetical protein LUE27_10325 [Clostridia bacterium]|nr:hypothetical protein [Clostridia bacterium]